MFTTSWESQRITLRSAPYVVGRKRSGLRLVESVTGTCVNRIISVNNKVSLQGLRLRAMLFFALVVASGTATGSDCADFDFVDVDGLGCREYEILGYCRDGIVTKDVETVVFRVQPNGKSAVNACCACGGGYYIG